MTKRQGCAIALVTLMLVGQSLAQSENVTFLSRMSLNRMGGGTGSDIWGWQDPVTGQEIAIMGRSNGTAFVDVTDGRNPVYLGNLPTQTDSSFWRDMKVYNNHAYIVSDNNGPHGMQIFDLTQLRDVTTPQTFSNTAFYNRRNLRSAHNIAINEDSGTAFIVGAGISGGGLHMLDLSNPTNPTYVGEFTDDGYTHDAQAVIYNGPDSTHAGREIVFASNEDTITIVDVTNKSNPTQLGRRGYPESGYTHQGWLTEDQQYFIFNDEADEFSFTNQTRTHVMDVRNLDNPQYVGFYEHSTTSIDHNLYVKGDYVFEANYNSGLQILEIDDIANAEFTRAGFFDTSDAWSVYPYFDNGKVIVSDIRDGLYVLEFDALVNNVDADFNDDGVYDCADIDALTAAIASGANDSDFDLNGDGNVDLGDQSQWLSDAGGNNLSPGSAYLPGDANLDGGVDVADFNLWNANRFTNNSAWCAGNFNGDSQVDVGDFGLWNANKFTSSDSAAAAVPEPSGVALF